jgi:prepilin-type N-terminal cleavage/methylation domain-containing protein
MSKRQLGRAFTLIELLVVVAIIALLISILLPTLRRAKDQAKKAVCLAHLHDIGSAAHQYASEDENNRAMPMSPIMVRAHDYWYRRCAMWYSWGGRGATQPCYFTPTSPKLINELNERPYYGTRQRPLTVYIYPDIEEGRSATGAMDSYVPSDAPVFECPGDRGYPDLPQEVMDDAPAANAGNRMFDTVGNSYRGSLACYLNLGNAQAFSVGIWGQRLDRLENTGQLLWGGDPLFYGFIGSDSSGPLAWPEVKRYGWHGEFQVDNELYADGHAKPTLAVPKDDPTWMPSDADLVVWGVDPEYAEALSRGPGYQIDAYPVPGVAIVNWPVAGHPTNLWPWKGYTICRRD